MSGGRRTATAITPASTSIVGTTAQSFQCDGAGRMTFARDTVGTTSPGNTDATFAYDSLGRTVEEVQTFGTDHRYVTHDQFTGYTATDLTYPSGRQVASGYDPLYRRNAITEVTGGTSIAQWYFYGDRVATVVLGNGQTVSMMNNAQTHSAVQPTVANPPWNSSSPTPMDDRLGYDGSGRMITKRYVQSAGSTSAALVVGYTTAYDASGNKFYERALHAPDRSALYDQYDSMDRLADYQRGTLAVGGGSVTPSTMSLINSQQSYNLDALGNWTSTTYTPVGSASTTQMRVHNLLNEVTSYGSTPTPVLYDHGSNSGSSASQGNGNIVDDGVRTLAYDALNRVNTVSRKSDGLLVATYTYDALGRRTRKVVSNGGVTGPADPVANSTFRYVYDGQQIVEELNASNTTVRQEVWGQYIDELIQLQVAGGTYVFYPLSDLLYRTIAITDPTGAIKQVYDTDAYGNTLIFETGGGTGGAWFSDNDATTVQPACETIFTGRLYDPETQLYWYRARYYNPMLGRFMGRDPIQERMNFNFYEYCQGSPNGYLDPTGEKCECTFMNKKMPRAACNAKTLFTWQIVPERGVCDPGAKNDKCDDFCTGGILWHCRLDQGIFDPVPVFRWIPVLEAANDCNSATIVCAPTDPKSQA